MVFKQKDIARAFVNVWEWCKDIWYSNFAVTICCRWRVWEWCKDIWYSNGFAVVFGVVSVWEWCKDIWYSNLPDGIASVLEFENDVKIYGIQTRNRDGNESNRIENDVKIYGIQTRNRDGNESNRFENDVKIYGIQTMSSHVK